MRRYLYDFDLNSIDNEQFQMNILRICRHCNLTGEQTFMNATFLSKKSE